MKWDKESAGQWKVLGLLRKQWFFQPRLGGAEGDISAGKMVVDGGGAVGDRGHHGCLKTLQCAPWKVQKDIQDLHGSECEFVQSILEGEKKNLPLGRAMRSLVCGCSCNFSAP